jgi:hypothetical protein
MIFTFGQRLALIATPGSAPCDTAEVLWLGKTVAEDTSMSVYQNSEAIDKHGNSVNPKSDTSWIQTSNLDH